MLYYFGLLNTLETCKDENSLHSTVVFTFFCVFPIELYKVCIPSCESDLSSITIDKVPRFLKLFRKPKISLKPTS